MGEAPGHPRLRGLQVSAAVPTRESQVPVRVTCGAGAHRFRFRRAPPAPRQRRARPPPGGAGTNPGKRGENAAIPLPAASRAPCPPPRPTREPLGAAEADLPGITLLQRRMRFWLRKEEMALEEMVQRLNAVSKHTGRRSCWPGIIYS
jgi:hypothetical protein